MTRATLQGARQWRGHAEAAPLLREALAGMRATLGDTHPDTLTSVHNLAALRMASTTCAMDTSAAVRASRVGSSPTSSFHTTCGVGVTRGACWASRLVLGVERVVYCALDCISNVFERFRMLADVLNLFAYYLIFFEGFQMLLDVWIVLHFQPEGERAALRAGAAASAVRPCLHAQRGRLLARVAPEANPTRAARLSPANW